MNSIYQDIAQRTNSNIYIGIVGPVRTGKSTFIKRFMETMVIPNIDNVYMKERTKDELPQSGSGKSIMTSEPKFVPEEAVSVSIDGTTELSVRMIDCVGYMIPGASGRFENGEERMVSTPWFDHEISMTEAAETGTKKVITDHSTIGLVITTDGSVCGIPREDYVEAEKRVLDELKSIGKPFIALVNCTDPTAESVREICNEIETKYHISALPVNCLELNQQDITEIIRNILLEFPLVQFDVILPTWVESLPYETPLLASILNSIRECTQTLYYIKDVYHAIHQIEDNEYIENVTVKGLNMGTGTATVSVSLPRELYYKTISAQSGFEIHDDGQLLSLLTAMRNIKTDYDQICHALKEVRENGYGIVLPTSDQLTLQEPEIVKNGGKYSVKLKANAPAIHMIMTNVETTVTPAIGGESASEEIINFLLQGFDGDPSRIWESNIFGKSLYDIASEGVYTKLSGMNTRTKSKFQETLQRVINEGAGGLICIIL